jgi:hypothetical protein
MFELLKKKSPGSLVWTPMNADDENSKMLEYGRTTYGLSFDKLAFWSPMPASSGELEVSSS